jgi:hypothetical protein
MKNVSSTDLDPYTRGQLVRVCVVAVAWAVFYFLLLPFGGNTVDQAQREQAGFASSGAPVDAELLSASRIAPSPAGHPAGH